MLKHSDGVVRTDAELSCDGAALPLAIRQQAKEVGKQFGVVEGPVFEGQRNGKRGPMVRGIVREMRDSLLILPERARYLAVDCRLQVDGCH